MKIADPIMLVSMPSGISPESKVLPKVSQVSRNSAPSTKEPGKAKRASDPNTRLLIWGMIRPTHPTRPAVDMMAVVPMVATNKRRLLSLAGERPMEWAVRSSNESRLMRHRLAARMHSVTSMVGSTETTMLHELFQRPPIIQKVISCKLVVGSANNFNIESPEENNAPTAMPESTKRRIQPPKRNRFANIYDAISPDSPKNDALI